MGLRQWWGKLSDWWHMRPDPDRPFFCPHCGYTDSWLMRGSVFYRNGSWRGNASFVCRNVPLCGREYHWVRR
jgi:hypothetical protein